MIYDLILPLAGAFIIILIVLLRKGKAAREQQSARRRSTRSGLVLERSPREKKAGKSSLSGLLMIAVPLIIIGVWLAASYSAPGGPEIEPETAAATGPEREEPEDSRVLSGRIVMGEDSPSAPVAPPAAAGEAAPMAAAAISAGAAGAAAAQNTAQNVPAAVEAPQAPLSTAAQAMLPTVSRMEQVGLLPAKGAGNGIAAKRPQAQKPPVAAPKAQPLAPKAEPVKAAPPKPTAPKADDDNVILGGGREFTVHLASFADRGNAEKYLGKLVTARVKDAFLTESTVDGRLWYRVMSGRFASQAQAEAHGSDLRRRNLTTSGGRYVIKSIP